MTQVAAPTHLLRYRAFGQSVACDRYLDFRVDEEVSGMPAFTVLHDRDLPTPVHAKPIHQVEDYPGGPLLSVSFGDGDTLLLISYGAWHFALSRDLRHISYSRSDEADEADWDLAMERIVLPICMLFAHPSLLPLHGSAVEFRQRGWVFIGESGVGKSTTASQFSGSGSRLLSDDMCLLDTDRTAILPGPPAIRLWEQPGALHHALSDRPVHRRTTKRWFRLHDESALESPIPLAGIIWLDPCADAPLGGQLTRLTGQQGLASLLRQCFDFTCPPKDWMIRRLQNARALFAASALIRYQYRRSPDGEATHVEALRQWILETETRLVP